MALPASGDDYLVGEVAFEQTPGPAPGRLDRPIKYRPPPLRSDLQSVVEPETPAVQIALQLLRSSPTPLRSP